MLRNHIKVSKGPYAKFEICSNLQRNTLMISRELKLQSCVGTLANLSSSQNLLLYNMIDLSVYSCPKDFTDNEMLSICEC